MRTELNQAIIDHLRKKADQHFTCTQLAKIFKISVQAMKMELLFMHDELQIGVIGRDKTYYIESAEAKKLRDERLALLEHSKRRMHTVYKFDAAMKETIRRVQENRPEFHAIGVHGSKGV